MDTYDTNDESPIKRRQIFITGSMIRQIIKNPVYRGIVRVKTQNTDVSPKAPSKVDWEEFKGNHEALVSEDTWFQSNRLIQCEKKTERVPRKQVSMGLLQGLLVCACCNASMCPGAASRVRKTGEKHWYYRCSQKAKGASLSECTTKQISGSAIETAIAVLIQAVESNAAILVRFGHDPTSRKREAEIAACRAETLRLETKVHQIQREIGNLLGFVQRGESDVLSSDAIEKAGQLKLELANLENHRLQQETRLHKLAGRVPQISELGAAFGPIARALQFSNHAQKYEIFHQIVRKIYLRRVTLGGEQSLRSAAVTRTFRMSIEVVTDALVRFGKNGFDSLQTTKVFSNVVLKVTFEIISNAKEQKVVLLEQGYECVAAKFEAPEIRVTSPEPMPSNGNPIQRAIRWKTLISSGETAVALASREGVSEGLISQYLSLLSLPQLIVDFMKEGRERACQKPISSRELLRLKTLPPNESVSLFLTRVAGAPIQGSLPLTV